jgi:cell division protein FtsL
MGIVTLCQMVNLLSVIAIPFIVSNQTYSTKMVLLVGIPLYAINCCVLTHKKYILLKEKWTNENHKNKKLKGYLIVLYIILSLGIYFTTLFIMANNR